VPGGLRSYDLFALTVAVMVMGHVPYYFMSDVPDTSWYRLADRIMVPVFLVSVGYNAGHRLSRFLWGGAFILTALNWILTREIYLDVLGTIILVRLIVNPLMEWALRSRNRFMGLNAALLLLFPVTNAVIEYGTLGLIMAMAGWINRNRGEIPPDIVKPSDYFLGAWAVFTGCIWFTFQFSPAQAAIVAAGSAWTMHALYNFRQLLLNTLAAPPRDPLEKFCSFLGHKSLEIYVAHCLLFQAAMVCFTR
jgi:hypothetical protein